MEEYRILARVIPGASSKILIEANPCVDDGLSSQHQPRCAI